MYHNVSIYIYKINHKVNFILRFELDLFLLDRQSYVMRLIIKYSFHWAAFSNVHEINKINNIQAYGTTIALLLNMETA